MGPYALVLIHISSSSPFQLKTVCTNKEGWIEEKGILCVLLHYEGAEEEHAYACVG